MIMIMNDYLYSTMPSNCDNCIWIFDIDNLGLSQLYMDELKAIIKFVSEVFQNTNNKTVVVNSGFIAKMGWNMIKPFLEQRQVDKIQFLDEISIECFRAAGVHVESLP